MDDPSRTRSVSRREAWARILQGPKANDELRAALAFLVYFTLLTVLVTWPQAAHATSSITGEAGDNLYLVWLIGWFKKALIRWDPLWEATQEAAA